MNKPQLAIDNSITDSDWEDVFTTLRDNGMLSFDGGDDEPQPAPVHYRHQLLHMDFWYVVAALSCQLAIMTSFIPMNAFEPLVVASIVLLFMAVVSNLTREKQGIILHEIAHKWIINIRWPWGYIPARAPLFERVQF